MTATYEKIATNTLGSATNSITFSSISGSYTDLVLISSITGFSDPSYSGALRFNSDTGSNYSLTNLYGDGSSAGSDRTTSVAQIQFYGKAVGVPNAVSTGITNILNYSNATTYKTALTRWGAAGNGLNANVGLWRSTSAITSVTIFGLNSNTFATGSTFTLYGILKEA
jgi:hypothetical protein